MAVQAVLAGVGLRAEAAVEPAVPQSDVVVEDVAVLVVLGGGDVLQAPDEVAHVFAQPHRAATWFSRGIRIG
jgi:hypothetical protein